jgi:tetratricopeptide repeat protein
MLLSPKIFTVLFLVPLYGVLSAQGQTTVQPTRMGEVTTQSKGQDDQRATLSALQNPAEQAALPVVPDAPELQRFIDQARSLLLREDFTELDGMADAARVSKARFPGGGWKLSRFYEAVNNRDAGRHQTDADWQSHLALLQRWTVARPQSITARLALADAYLRYAWVARGEGYANTVTDQGWRYFQERTDHASKILADTAVLPLKCPHFYELAQEIALASGADASQQRTIFEKAIKFEPLYFAYYQRYAETLLPKWGGEPGEIEAFAEESYRRVGGKEGAHIYFEIASNLCGRCGDFSADGFSWQKLQEGFAATEELYGLSTLKANRFAFLAATYGDRVVAAKTFLRIGPNWDYTVWGSRARFESQRTWAGLPASPQPTAPNQSQPAPPPASAKVEEMLQLAEKSRIRGEWNDSTQMARQAIKTAESMPGTAVQLGHAYLIIANNEYSQGHAPTAQQMLDNAVSVVSEKAGLDSLEFASTLVQAALSAQVMSDYARAETNLRKAVEIREKRNGASDPELCNDLTILGNLYQVRGRTKEAMEMYQRAISIREPNNNGDLALISPLEELGMTYRSMGRNDDAEKTFLRVLHLMEDHFGLNSSALVDPLSKLASLYQVMGKTANEEQTRKRLQAIQAQAPK